MALSCTLEDCWKCMSGCLHQQITIWVCVCLWSGQEMICQSKWYIASAEVSESKLPQLSLERLSLWFSVCKSEGLLSWQVPRLISWSLSLPAPFDTYKHNRYTYATGNHSLERLHPPPCCTYQFIMSSLCMAEECVYLFSGIIWIDKVNSNLISL